MAIGELSDWLSGGLLSSQLMLISMEESTLKRVSSKIQIAIPGVIFLLVDTRRRVMRFIDDDDWDK
jgi:hypothetical protein